MSKDERGRNSSLCEKPVRSRPRKLVDWIDLPDVRKGHLNKSREQETEPCQTGLRWRDESPADDHREAIATALALDFLLSTLSNK